MDRFDAIARYKKMRRSDLQRFLGLTEGTFSHMRDNVSAFIFNKVMARMPEINPVWLLVGRGEMLMADEEERTRHQYLAQIEELKQKLARADMTIENYKMQIDIYRQLILDLGIRTNKGDGQ